ncbi:MAG: mandelate racemase [Betaproteobacteria bacterium RIFCSPLOWO2_12_FULL_68_19]|nr:MAG: mandelate racemase [Betaproteobacteria bacterium RIFCSPLOWO2_12_FULL_68_19]
MRFSVKEISLFERDVVLRLPFRFGAATLTRAPQAFVRARIRLENGRESQGAAAELLAPKWFDKDPGLSNEENFAQLRASLALAREAYLAGGENSAFGHWIDNYGPQIALGAAQGLNALVACYGPALIDRALLDALCRALGVSFFQAIQGNLAGIAPPGWQADLAAFGMAQFLAALKPGATIAARHTVGLADPLGVQDKRIGDGLPETLEEVVARYGQRWFKLKASGEPQADVERLAAIAAVLDRIEEPYRTTLDGNEQYDDVRGALELWRRVKSEPRLRRLAASVAFIEQPVKRSNALSGDISELAEERPVIIDESDDSLEAFPRARRLGYSGVSSKTCKGLYKSLLNAARCRMWNREEGSERYFMSGEDLTVQPGLALQQDLALVSLLGLSHVERNGHHYVNGMAGLPEAEQAAFLAAHPGLYERSHGAVRLKIVRGMLSLESLDCSGYASGAMPEWESMRTMQ